MTPDFCQRITGAYGSPGAAWLHQLSETLIETSERWSITLSPPYQPLSYNYVAPAITQDGEPVVLKAGVPNPELSTEIDTLRHLDGQCAVRLFDADADADRGLLLLERIAPGVPLLETRDDELATSALGQVMRRLHNPAPVDHDFPGMSVWAKGFVRLRNRFGGRTGPLPEATVDRAEQLMPELISSMSDPIVLHGDLHHWNILSARREPCLAIDPKGIMGEPECELAAWLRNPLPRFLNAPQPGKLIARRVDQLVEELGFERDRVLGWAYCLAVLSAVWSYEEGRDDLNGELVCVSLIADSL